MQTLPPKSPASKKGVEYQHYTTITPATSSSELSKNENQTVNQIQGERVAIQKLVSGSLCLGGITIV